MAYITYDQFVALYGATIPEADFPVYATQASDLIDTITRFKIVQGGGIAALPSWVQTQVEKATAAQCLYFWQNGMETVLTGESGAGFTVGKVHVDGGAGRNTAGGAAASMVSPWTKALLGQTGLMGREIPCFDQFRSNFFGMW